VHRQQHRWPRRLREVEVPHQVAEDRFVLAHAGTWIGAAVGRRVEALAAEEDILDELQVSVEAERLVVDVACVTTEIKPSPPARAVSVGFGAGWAQLPSPARFFCGACAARLLV
jgi:hypothetical protein